MEMPLPDILDRLSILELKVARIGEPHLIEEKLHFEEALDLFLKNGQADANQVERWLDQLQDINARIWDLAADIRQGKENSLGLEEVGRRALAIRDLDKDRSRIKYEIFQTIN